MSENRPRRSIGAPAVCALACVLGAGAPAARGIGDFKINLYVGPGLAANPAAVEAFGRAAADWESHISNPIRVNIEANLTTFGGNTNVIGSTGFGDEEINLPYDTVRNAMAARANRPGNGSLAYLPTSAQINANTPAAPNKVFDKQRRGVLRANQKARGLIDNAVNDPLPDGTITFNPDFTFDYDRR